MDYWESKKIELAGYQPSFTVGGISGFEDVEILRVFRRFRTEKRKIQNDLQEESGGPNLRFRPMGKKLKNGKKRPLTSKEERIK